MPRSSPSKRRSDPRALEVPREKEGQSGSTGPHPFAPLRRWTWLFLSMAFLFSLVVAAFQFTLPALYSGEPALTPTSWLWPLHEHLAAHRAELPDFRNLPYYRRLLNLVWLRGLVVLVPASGLCAVLSGMVKPWRAFRLWLFQPADPRNLAALRMAVFTAMVLVWDPQLVGHLASAPRDLVVAPLGLGWLGDWLVPSPGATLIWTALFLPSALAAAAGLWTRWTAPLATVTAMVVLGIPQYFGKLNHYHHLIWLGLLLSVSACADAWSVDRYLAKRQGKPHPPIASSETYGVPLRLSWLLLSVCYFFPGIWKLLVGIPWLDGTALRGHLHSNWIALDGWTPVFRIDQFPLLLTLASMGTVAFELSFPFLILFRRTRLLALVGGVVFHVLIGLQMRIWFWPLMLMYVAFIDWPRLRGGVDEVEFGKEEMEFGKAEVKSGRDAVESGREGGDASFPGRKRLKPALLAGGSLLAVNVLCGVLQFDSWPIGLYPTFASTPGTTSTALIAEVVRGDEVTQIPTRELRGNYPVDRWAGMVRAAVRESGEGRANRFSALAEFIESTSPHLFADADAIRFLLAHRTLESSKPLRLQRLIELRRTRGVSVDDASGPHVSELE